MSATSSHSLEDAATTPGQKMTKQQFREHIANRDALIKARALEQAAQAARAAFSPEACPWVGFLDDRAAWLRKQANA